MPDREPHWTDRIRSRPIFVTAIDGRGHRSNIISIQAAAMSMMGDLCVPYDRIQELSNKVTMAETYEEAIGHIEQWFPVKRDRAG